MRGSDRALLAPQARPGRAQGPARERPLHPGHVRRGFGLSRAGRPARRVRAGCRRAAQPRLLPLDGARVLPGHRRQARRLQALPPPAHRRGAASSRSRSDRASSDRAGAQPRGAGGLRGDPDLPHRPLPRQGDGAEPAGVSLRQRDVRADLEPQLRRSRADHGGRGHRRRHARRLLRHDGRAARHDAEPHDAAARLVAMEPPVTFSAEEVRNEKVKVLEAIPEPKPQDIGDIAVGRSTERATRAARTSSATWKGACRPTPTPRPTPRCA